MNLQLHHVISDVTGTTGLAIIEAVLSGERDVCNGPQKLDTKKAFS
jgi:transposase